MKFRSSTDEDEDEDEGGEGEGEEGEEGGEGEGEGEVEEGGGETGGEGEGEGKEGEGEEGEEEGSHVKVFRFQWRSSAESNGLNRSPSNFGKMLTCFVCNLPIQSHQVGLVWQGGNGVDDLLREQMENVSKQGETGEKNYWQF